MRDFMKEFLDEYKKNVSDNIPEKPLAPEVKMV